MWSVGFSCKGYVVRVLLDDDDDMGAPFWEMVESVLSVRYGAACDGGGESNCCMWLVGCSKGYVVRKMM